MRTAHYSHAAQQSMCLSFQLHYGYDAFGNALGNSVVRASQSTGTTNGQSGGGDRGSRSEGTSSSTTVGGNSSQGAENLTQQNRIQFPDEGIERITVTPNWDEINSDGFLPFSMTNLGMQVARNTVASANSYREQGQVLGDRVSQVNARIAATAGQNTIRDASYLVQFNSERGNGLIAPPMTPGPWRDEYVFAELNGEAASSTKSIYANSADQLANFGDAVGAVDLMGASARQAPGVIRAADSVLQSVGAVPASLLDASSVVSNTPIQTSKILDFTGNLRGFTGPLGTAAGVFESGLNIYDDYAADGQFDTVTVGYNIGKPIVDFGVGALAFTGPIGLAVAVGYYTWDVGFDGGDSVQEWLRENFND